MEAILIAVGLVAALPLLALGAIVSIGFTPAGIAGSSCAALMMSLSAPVAVGSVVALLQSAGASGLPIVLLVVLLVLVFLLLMMACSVH